MNKKGVKVVLQNEIKWCKSNIAKDQRVDLKFKKGFIAGLTQAKRLIAKMEAK